MERLVGALSAVVSAPLADPLRAEHIAVPSPGMERWLSMELSKRLGIWANPAFPFPRNLIETAMAAVLGDAPEPGAAPDPYEPATLLFALARLLPTMLDQPELAPVADYLTGDTHARRRLALARRMANMFDQYATYRPEQVLAWTAGKEQHFQAKLFAALQAAYGPRHMAARAHAFLSTLSSASTSDVRARLSTVLPERISVFGVSTLPPLYVQLLSALARHIEVHVFLLSPSPEYYGDLRSYREIDALRRRQDKQHDVDLDARELSHGHPLLASLGRHGRELQMVLEDVGGYHEVADDLYDDPGQDTLLHRIQSDLLHLRDPAEQPRQALPLLSPGDESLSIHACHGQMREVEVLHDQLLATFAQTGVEPHEVIVMTPDIEAYAPMIDAVFSEASGRPRIDFRIADRGALRTQEVAGALDAVLDALPGRLGVSTVLDLLGTPVIRARFGLSADDVERARELLADSGVRWGVDEAHRAEVGQPAFAENTWRFGLERLALGYALPAGGHTLFQGRAPADVEAGDAELIGRVLELCHALFAQRAELAVPCSVSQWVARLRDLVAALIVRDATTIAEHGACQRALDMLARRAQRCGFDEVVDLTALRPELSAALDACSPPAGFLSGGVTFCQLVPMRSIPFQVVCLLGLSDGAFPKSEPRLGFDLIAKQRRPGDRSRLHDDRQLFLEALLSARRRMLITYVGHGIHDGKARPPSVLVSELIEHVERSSRLPEESASASERAEMFRRRLCVDHPLQPFSPRNFGEDGDPRLFSYAHGHCAAARALRASTRTRPVFLDGLDIQAAAPVTQVTLADLEAWIAAPVRWFVRRRLGVVLGTDQQPLEDREPMKLDPLATWTVGDDLLARGMRQEDPRVTETYVRALGGLPLGTPGQLEYRRIAAPARAIVAAAAAYAQGDRRPTVDVDLDLEGVRLVGALPDVWQDAQVRTQYSRTGNRHELKFFLRHVVLCALSQRNPAAGLPTRSVLLGRAGDDVAAVTLSEVAEPTALLRAWVALYAAGQHFPLPLFEQSSRAFVEAVGKGLSKEGALAAAARKFAPSDRDNVRNDGDDDYVRLAFSSFDEVLEMRAPYDFATVAARIYGPLLAHRGVP